MADLYKIAENFTCFKEGFTVKQQIAKLSAEVLNLTVR
jgi:hypothetical protein